MSLEDAVIVSSCRTPIGKFLGGLSSLSAPELGAIVVKESLARAGVKVDDVDEVILGNVLQAGVGQAPARQAALKAGLPGSVAALTINKVCGSGLKAVMLASQAIRLGDAMVIVAGGMESMSNAPFLLKGVRNGWKFGDQTAVDHMQSDGLTCAFEGCAMGNHAEHTAADVQISREDQDAFAAESQRRATEAIKAGYFKKEIVTVDLGPKKPAVEADEVPRADTTAEKLAALRPVFQKDGTVTAGNASALSDGAAAVVVTSRSHAQKLGKPMARIIASATAGLDPRDLFVAPVQAIKQVLAKAELKLKDIDLFEINEAFAAQMLGCVRGLDLPADRVNVNGGGIALGHPIGASGARVLVTLLHELERRGAKRGIASLCLGGGNAVAMIVERE